MTRECKNLYKELCLATRFYNQGIIAKNELVNNLGWFISCNIAENIEPQTRKIDNYLERVLVNGR